MTAGWQGALRVSSGPVRIGQAGSERLCQPYRVPCDQSRGRSCSAMKPVQINQKTAGNSACLT